MPVVSFPSFFFPFLVPLTSHLLLGSVLLLLRKALTRWQPHISKPFLYFYFYLFFDFCFVLFCFCFLGPHPRHMEVPRLGIQSELQLPAYTTAHAMPDPLPTERGQGSNTQPHGI